MSNKILQAPHLLWEMEAASNFVAKMHQRSSNMCYTLHIVGWRFKKFQHLMPLNIYGRGKPIKKKNVSNHISKRLGTGLRSKVKDWRIKGVCIDGKTVGSFKETTIVKSNLLQKAIKR
ncbi:hypothetical protein TNCV_1672711 [Trichonephila clavipes]|nr:hypothetical protein TNCV_1672711 [Trichonephila clavipes]